MFEFKQTKETNGKVVVVEDGKQVGEIITMGDVIIEDSKPNNDEVAEYMRKIRGF